jgi:hypothetical protein
MAAAAGEHLTGSGVREIAPGICAGSAAPGGCAPGSSAPGRVTRSPRVARCCSWDPLVTGEDDPALGVLDGLAQARVRILIGKPYHTRSAEPLWRRYRRAQARHRHP